MSSKGGVSTTGAILVLAALIPAQPFAQVESLELLGSIGGSIGTVLRQTGPAPQTGEIVEHILGREPFQPTFDVNVDGDVDSADVVSNSEEMN
jgi:hypothetical protein